MLQGQKLSSWRKAFMLSPFWNRRFELLIIMHVIATCIGSISDRLHSSGDLGSRPVTRCIAYLSRPVAARCTYCVGTGFPSSNAPVGSVCHPVDFSRNPNGGRSVNQLTAAAAAASPASASASASAAEWSQTEDQLLQMNNAAQDLSPRRTAKWRGDPSTTTTMKELQRCRTAPDTRTIAI